MKRLLAGICALVLPFLQFPVRAQTAALAAMPDGPFSYNLSEEVTLNGTVSSVLMKQLPNMVAGSHLLLTTLSGLVDVSLGTFALRGKDSLSIALGQQVQVVGVMKTLKDKQVLLARAVKVGDRVYVIRNEHGVPVSPQARERASQKAAQNRETR